MAGEFPGMGIQEWNNNKGFLWMTQNFQQHLGFCIIQGDFISAYATLEYLFSLTNQLVLRRIGDETMIVFIDIYQNKKVMMSCIDSVLLFNTVMNHALGIIRGGADEMRLNYDSLRNDLLFGTNILHALLLHSGINFSKEMHKEIEEVVNEGFQ